MDKILPLLRKRRTARRDTALGHVATARAQRDGAHAALLQTAVRLREALNWLSSVRQGQGQGQDAQWRQATLLSCNALVEREHAALAQAETVLERAKQVLAERQVELMKCERALMRTDELQALAKQASAEAERLREQDLDDDLAAAWRPRKVLTLPRKSLGTDG
jgi:hypothetical protein